MALTTDFNFTYTGQQSYDFLYKPGVMVPQITQLFTVRQGIRSKQQVPVIPLIRDIVKKYEGCGQGATGSAVIGNCTIETENMWVHFVQCFDTFRDHVLEGLLPFGLDSMQGGAQLQGIINRMLAEGMAHDNFRILSFGDTTSLSTKYDQMNGLWTWIISNTSEYCVPKIDAIGSGALADGAALTYLKNLYEGARIELKQLPRNMKGFYVTGSVMENLMTSYESNTTGSDLQMQTLQDGITQYKYRGINIYEYYAWDEALLDTLNPLNGTAEHLMLYTTPAVHILGLGRVVDMEGTRAYFSEEDDQYHVKAMYNMGYQSCLCEFSAASW